MQIAPNNFYYSTICHFCKDVSAKLQRCSSCKIVAYCTKEHQKLDWLYHKELCKVVGFVGTITKHNNYSFNEWKEYCLGMQLKWSTLLKRDLYPFECQMWMFPRVCTYCYSQSNLTDCSECLNVAYCSNDHKEKHSLVHKRYCKSLRLCLSTDIYLYKFKEYPQIQLQMNPNDSLPKDMHNLLDASDTSVNSNNSEDILIKRALKSEALTFGSSMFYTICRLSLPRNNKCVLHIVGASAAEGTTDWVLTSELLYHSFPHLNRISYYLIGPEAWDISYNVDLCENCSGKTVNIIVKKDLYHNVVLDLEKPDYIFAFNSGFHEFENQECDQWQISIPFLFVTDVPFIFTSYTEEEAARDLTYIKRIIPETDLYVLESKANPFSSLRPVRDWCTKDVPVFYSNAFIVVIKPTATVSAL